MKRRPRRKRKALDIILAAICASSLAAAALIGLTILHEGAVYSDISAVAGAAEGGGIDWEALRARNPDISAWVSVEGTPIGYPVVSPREGDPQGFYLNHDFDRNWSFAGCPYLDPRGTADGRHALVYGHHLNFDSEMFTYLRNAWRQEKFDTLGDMYWSTPDGGTMRLHPAFSLSVDKSFAGIQRFDLTGAAETRTWLADLSAQASARADGCDDLCAHATRAVTLVTCTGTSQAAGQGPSRYSSAEYFRQTCHTIEKRHKRGDKNGYKKGKKAIKPLPISINALSEGGAEMDGSAKLPPPAPVGITELKNNFASIAKRVHDTSVPCTVLKQGRAYVAIVPVDPGYRTMGKYACNQYTRVLRRLFTFCRNAHDHRITFVLRRRNEDYVAIAPLDPPDTED